MVTKEMIDKFSKKENPDIREVNEELCQALLGSEGFHTNCAPVIGAVMKLGTEKTKGTAITMMASAMALVQYGYELRKYEETHVEVEEEVPSAN